MSPNDPQSPKRTFDERMDALAMHVELHAGMMRDFDLRMEEHEQARRENEALIKMLVQEGKETSARLDKLIKAVEIDAENIRALARIAEAHQDRIEKLEGGPPAR